MALLSLYGGVGRRTAGDYSGRSEQVAQIVGILLSEVNLEDIKCNVCSLNITGDIEREFIESEVVK